MNDFGPWRSETTGRFFCADRNLESFALDL
jgi:hypothetical protein